MEVNTSKDKTPVANMVVTEEQKIALIDVKKKVENIVAYIVIEQKRHGKTKESKAALKVMNEFLKCNITNPAIFRKYHAVVTFIEKYAQQEALTNDSQA